MMRFADYDAALQVEAELWPDRAGDIAAERERIAGDLELELALPVHVVTVDADTVLSPDEVEQLVADALAATDDVAKATK